MNFETGDMVTNPLFGKGSVIESYGSKVVVKFEKFGLKTVNKDIFEADQKRLTKKKDIAPDLQEVYHNENLIKRNFITNDMI